VCTKILIASLLFFSLFAVSSIEAEQLVSLNGRVVDDHTNLPVVKATVTLLLLNLSTTSDNSGKFTISEITTGRYTLRVTHVGYRAATVPVSVDTASREQLVVRLIPKAIHMGETTVTVSRSEKEEFIAPASVSVAAREEFRLRGFSSTAEVLREESGILVQKTTHGHGAPILRGLIGKHVLLLYNGIRLNKPTFRFGGNQYLNTIDLGSLERIEVVRGPSSVLYGSDAIGGTVNLVSPKLAHQEDDLIIRPQVTTRYASADNSRLVGVNLSANGANLSTRFTGTYKKVDDLRAGGDLGRQRPTGWEEINLNSSLQYRINSANRFVVDYLMVRQDKVPRYDKYVSGEYRQYLYDPQNRDLVALTYARENSGQTFRSLKCNISYQRELEGRTQQKTNSNVITYVEDKLITWGGYVQSQVRPQAAHLVVFGGEYYYDDIGSRRSRTSDNQTETIRPTYPDNSKYHSTGLFLQDEFSITGNMTLTGGARWSYIRMESPLEEPFDTLDEVYDDLTGSVALSYRIIPTVNLIARWSRGFRAPNLNDAAVLKVSSSGVDAPSIGLEPEKSNNYELGIKVRDSWLSGNFFVHYNQLSSLINRRPGTYDGKTFLDENGNGVKDNGEFDIFQRRNVGRARIYGFESEAAVEFSDRWQARFNCFWTFGENQTDNEPLSRIPPLMGMVAVKMKTSSSTWIELYSRMAAAQRRLSQRDIDDTRITFGGTPSWITLNFRTEATWRDVTINVILDNVLDAAYKEHGSGVYSPGRGVTISVAYGYDH